MLLRPMLEEDLNFMLEIRNESRQLMKNDSLFNLDQALEWFHLYHPENYIIVERGIDIGVMKVSRGIRHAESADVGGDIHKDYRREGYAKRAYSMLIPYLFGDCISELFLEVLEINDPALALYVKLGFQIHAYQPQMAPRKNGWLDGFVMNLTKTRWEINAKNISKE